ncbi:hypothetical protein [Alistipes sp.]|uniref:hypothetical protein n=1 Tax=Alistipes sp. TaxID=1872444 RepID=UPI003AEF1F48
MSRRRITLYIAGRPADLSQESLVQMNYAAEELSNPAVVKNSYSQQVTLPATRNNDAIFGGMFRADRRTVEGGGAGTGFNPLARTPFAIYDQRGELLESGYVKLDTVTRKKGAPAYVVTLYGGLGSFFYTLSYDDEGNALTLGDLPLFENEQEEVFFTINKETVVEAWDALRTGTSEQWRIVNFAPAYNGLPEGDFDPDKAMGKPEQIGGTSYHIAEDGKHYIPYGPNGEALYDLGEEFTEWQTKDLRSYLQRPVVSVKALIGGIARFAAARGFTLQTDKAWFHDKNPYYEKAWMTLPMIAGRTKISESDEFAIRAPEQLEGVAPYFVNPMKIAYEPGLLKSGAEVTVTCNPTICVQLNDRTPSNVGLNPPSIINYANVNRGVIVFLQVQLLDNARNIVGFSPVKLATTFEWTINQYPAATIANLANLETMNTSSIDPTIVYAPLIRRPETRESPYFNVWQMNDDRLKMAATGLNAVTAVLCFEWRVIYSDGDDNLSFHKDMNYNVYDLYSTYLKYPIQQMGGHDFQATLAYKLADEYRSNAEITQADLFADTISPMQFLLSYSKTFGLAYTYDKATRTVSLSTRNTLYDGEVIDLEARIDRSQQIKTTPVVATTKWLSFSVGESAGEFAEYYGEKYGREYGAQRVNTGYEFNADTKEVLDSAEFGGAAEVLERSIYFNNLTFGGRDTPSPFLNGKASYRLYHNGDKDTSIELGGLTPGGNGVEIDYFDDKLRSYDILPKLQCHGQDNEAADGDNILLFHKGCIAEYPQIARAYRRFLVTDDSSEMIALNGKPCWELSVGEPARDMPVFGRFWMKGREIVHSLEFATPEEVDLPMVSIGQNTTVYERFWRRYIEDRYHVDTRVRTLYVDWRGIQVGEHLLRKFYYADNALWVLNKISNYSLTGIGTTQCELVKVQDPTAYTAGQLLPVKYRLALNGAEADASERIGANGGEVSVDYQTNGTIRIGAFSEGLTVTVTDEKIVIRVPENTQGAWNYFVAAFCVAEDSDIERRIVIRQNARTNNTLRGALVMNITSRLPQAELSAEMPVASDLRVRFVTEPSEAVHEYIMPAGTERIVTDNAIDPSSARVVIRSVEPERDDRYNYVIVNPEPYYLRLGSPLTRLVAQQGGVVTDTVLTNGTPVIKSTLGISLLQVTLTGTSISVSVPANLSLSTRSIQVELTLEEDPGVTAVLSIDQLGKTLSPPDPVA